ncbi:ATP-binding protein [Longimicrobium sp.]|uniref:ATP-binding protein n=1 Tax=Longimicrobium sp. TaxID=2029185 RepID=UPI002C92C710|nr:ATP-binding protein [Longimicrobium sp.]HSU17307.1 ATP-binding protein [Longimicrobium sp.]
MATGWRELFFGPQPERAGMVEPLVPRRTFADVILPPSTRRQLDQALVQIKKHDMLFGDWGLGERHDTGLGLAFNFAGPPGTGKTICAEAIAHALGKRLLVVRYAELESQWAGMTSKNVSAVFEAAKEQDAVLFFDEADAIASRRFTQMDQGYQREANSVVNVLLREVEEFQGVVIFATNLAANFDPAFERRIRTHILFEMPGPEEREKIWRTQLHARKTPLAEDVDFRALAERYPGSGGDIKNAVLKAAQAAIAEPGEDADKRIGQRHFADAMEEVIGAKRVMDQSLFGAAAPNLPLPWNGDGAATPGDELRDDVSALAARLVEVEDTLVAIPEALQRLEGQRGEAQRRIEQLVASAEQDREGARSVIAQHQAAWERRLNLVLAASAVSIVLAVIAIALALVR